MVDFLDVMDAGSCPSQTSAVAAADDWIGVSESDLRAAHALAWGMMAESIDGHPARLRHARSVVLLEQVLAARGLVRAGHVSPTAARAAMRGDRALGYLFGLAASGGDPAAAPVSVRELDAALNHIHGLIFGSVEAHRLAESEATEVGKAFGDGLLAAERDLVALLHGGSTAALPMGLLAALPLRGLAPQRPSVRRH